MATGYSRYPSAARHTRSTSTRWSDSPAIPAASIMPFARATKSCAPSIAFETPCRSSNAAVYCTSSFVSLAVAGPRGSVASPYSSARANAGRSNWWATAIRMSAHTSSFSESPGACAMQVNTCQQYKAFPPNQQWHEEKPSRQHHLPTVHHRTILVLR